jgi:hypothetical protein
MLFSILDGMGKPLDGLAEKGFGKNQLAERRMSSSAHTSTASRLFDSWKV